MVITTCTCPLEFASHQAARNVFLDSEAPTSRTIVGRLSLRPGGRSLGAYCPSDSLEQTMPCMRVVVSDQNVPLVFAKTRCIAELYVKLTYDSIIGFTRYS